jgi:glycine/D-amino acid oxidase-like deaminating enzyme
MTPSYSDVPAVSERANRFFRAYDGTGEFTFTERPSVEVVPPQREGEARRRVDRLREAGIDVAFLEKPTLEERYPQLSSEGFVGGVEFTDTGWIDPYTFATALRSDAADRGAEIDTETAVEAVRVEGEAVTGVETEDGVIDADAVVVAAGWRTPALLDGIVDVPVRPYRTQCIVVDPGTSCVEAPIGWHPDEHVYFRPEHNGDLLVGGWSFAEDDPENASDDADEEFRVHVAELLPELFGELPDPRIRNGWAGVDAATPDTRPIVDAPGGISDSGRTASDAVRDDVPTGLVIATGFHGRGVMTSPVAATAVRSLLTGEETPFPLSTFAYDRFDEYSTDFEFTSISA